jgi:hypothetical protein
MPILQGQLQYEPLGLESPSGIVPAKVLDFCAQQGSIAYLQQAVSLALEHFKTVRKVETRLQQDPDVDVQRVIIDLTVEGEIDEVLASKEAFDEAWGDVAPTSQQDAIRLLFDFA